MQIKLLYQIDLPHGVHQKLLAFVEVCSKLDEIQQFKNWDIWKEMQVACAGTPHIILQLSSL